MRVSDPNRVRAVLSGLAYPVRTWQLCAQADAYGADSATREALSRLPVTAYASVDAVLTALRADAPNL
jgi:hypothetical protein